MLNLDDTPYYGPSDSKPNIKIKGASMSLLDRLKTIGTTKHSNTMSESTFFKPKDHCPTPVPIINVALSGSLSGGLISGLVSLAGPSKHFKSLLGLLLVKAYMDKHPDSMCLFYDSEFGVTPEYIKANGIDGSRVLHVPIENVEQLKFDMVKKLDSIEKSEKIIIFIDSIGNLASKKELEDAMSENSAADMTRSKQLKSFFRMVTPHLTMKDIPCVVVQHTYQTQEMFSKTVMSGGTGGMYSSNLVLLIGKSQEKDTEGIKGWNFNLTVEKSRFVKEKSKLSFLVTYEGGLNKWSGLMEEALESGHCTKPKNGWYAKAGTDKNYRLADTNNKEFWLPILTDPTFNEFISNKYKLAHSVAMISEEVEEEDQDEQ
jgi:RecA/RadA recombinase